MQEAYLLFKSQSAPEDRLELFRRWIEDAQTLQLKAQEQAQAQAMAAQADAAAAQAQVVAAQAPTATPPEAAQEALVAPAGPIAPE
jgi:pyridoxine/pyridoxamine 5'-phosphate oxidase